MDLVYYNYYYRTPNYGRKLRNKVSQLYLSLLDHKPRNYQSAVDCLCYNLMRIVKFEYSACHVLMGKNIQLRVPIVNGHIIGDKVNQANTIKLLNLLEENDYLFISRGYRVSSDNRENSFFCLADKMIDMVRDNVDMDKVKIAAYEDVLILRDDQKDQIEYLRNPMTRGMITQLKDFNILLGNHEILLSGEKKTVTFKRVFNDGSFELGGRFYTHGGEIQTLSSNSRRHITIDGEECCEGDIKGLHLALLYERQGEAWLEGFDPYNADLSQCAAIYPEDIESFVKDYNIPSGYNPVRSLAKLASLIMVNAENKDAAVGALELKYRADRNKIGTPDEGTRIFAGLAEESLDFERVIDEIVRHNYPIRDYFNSGCGKELQYLDSQIFSGVIQDFLDEDKVCLPIHDSAIVKKSDQAFLVESLVSNYEKVLGSSWNITVEVKW